MNDLLKRSALCAALLVVASAGMALAEAPYRALINDASALSQDETRIFRQINLDRVRHDLALLSADPRLTAVARLFSQDMTRHGYAEDYSPRLGTVRYQTRRAGVSTPDLIYMLIQTPNLDDFMRDIRQGDRPTHLQEFSHVGVGVSSTDRGHHVTIIFARSRSRLNEFPAMVEPGRSYELSGRLAEGMADPQVYLSGPDEAVARLDLAEEPDGFFRATAAFPQRGEYTLQISGTGKLGLQITDVMMIYAGIPYPPPPPRPQEEDRIDNLREAETRMLEMVNSERRQRGLEPFERDDSLAVVARGHSADMIENNYFAHVSPKRGELADRIREAGLNLKAFGENLARNRSLSGAHQGLMNSPQHRMNILSEGFTRLGIGILADRSGLLYVTQVFGTPFEELDPDETAENLLKDLNEARAESRLHALRRDESLDRAAAENSAAMMAEVRLSGDAAQREMGSLRDPRFRYTLTQTLMITGRPALEHFQLPPDANPRRFVWVGVGVVDEPATATTPPRFWITIVFAGQ